MKSKLPHSYFSAAILLLAAFLRFYHLSAQSLWSDEGNSAALARRGFTEIAQRTAFDIHPPLYYWLLKIWMVIWGDSEAGLRSLSAVLGRQMQLAHRGSSRLKSPYCCRKRSQTARFTRRLRMR